MKSHEAMHTAIGGHLEDVAKAVGLGTSTVYKWRKPFGIDEDTGVDNYLIEINGDEDNIVKVPLNSYTHRKEEWLTEGNTLYKENFYRVKATNEYGTSEWSNYYINNIIKAKAVQNKDLDLGLTATNVVDFDDYLMTVNYNPDVLEVVDLSSFTAKKEVTAGIIGTTGIEILSHESGRISFKVSKDIEEGYSWTGVLNNIVFNGQISGGTTITYMVEVLK